LVVVEAVGDIVVVRGLMGLLVVLEEGQTIITGVVIVLPVAQEQQGKDTLVVVEEQVVVY
jgi:hypothetical protein